MREPPPARRGGADPWSGPGSGPSPAARRRRDDAPRSSLAPSPWPIGGESSIEVAGIALPGAAPSERDERTHDEIVRDLINAHETERRRIARDVHDVVGQALTAVRIHLELIRRTRGPGGISLEADRAIATLDQALHEVRDLAFAIRPQILDDLGLVAACRWMVRRQARTVGYGASFDVGRVPRALPVEVEAACFRTLQEALTNIARHAAATRVTVSLASRDQALILSVGDDGVGFDARRVRRRRGGPGLGLAGITERVALVGGTVDVASRPGAGTTVIARLPVVPRP